MKEERVIKARLHVSLDFKDRTAELGFDCEPQNLANSYVFIRPNGFTVRIEAISSEYYPQLGLTVISTELSKDTLHENPSDEEVNEILQFLNSVGWVDWREPALREISWKS